MRAGTMESAQRLRSCFHPGSRQDERLFPSSCWKRQDDGGGWSSHCLLCLWNTVSLAGCCWPSVNTCSAEGGGSRRIHDNTVAASAVD